MGWGSGDVRDDLRNEQTPDLSRRIVYELTREIRIAGMGIPGIWNSVCKGIREETMWHFQGIASSLVWLK